MQETLLLSYHPGVSDLQACIFHRRGPPLDSKGDPQCQPLSFACPGTTQSALESIKCSSLGQTSTIWHDRERLFIGRRLGSGLKPVRPKPSVDDASAPSSEVRVHSHQCHGTVRCLSEASPLSMLLQPIFRQLGTISTLIRHPDLQSRAKWKVALLRVVDR